MRLGQVLVFADKEEDVIPKILVKVATQAIPDTLGFTNIDRRLPRFSIGTTQKIDA
jgi:hypothetical protein